MRGTKYKKPLAYTRTNENLLRGFGTLGVPPRLRDHTRCMHTGKSSVGPTGVTSLGVPRELTARSAKKGEILESEKHMWLESENNGRALAQETARSIGTRG